MSDAVVVDTNVLVIANDPFHQTGPECVEVCVRELDRTRKDRRLLLDWSRHILGEDPPILHATDRGWGRHRELLRRHGVSVRPICRKD